MNSPPRCYVGVDWSSLDHHVHATDHAGAKIGERSFPHGGDGLHAMGQWILERSRSTSDRVAVSIEVPHGPVVECLLDRGFAVHSINPKQLDRFRDRFSPAGAKDDSKDARVLASALRTDPHCFRRIELDDPETMALRYSTRTLRELKRERTRLSSRIREQLWRYYPAILDVSPTLWEPFFIALWRQAPTPQDAQSIRPDTIHTLLLRHGIRRFSAHRVKKTISARPLATPPGVAESAIAYIDLALARLERAHAQIHHVDLTLKHTLRSRIKRESANPDPSARRDAAILSSIPGIGPIVLATLLGEAAALVARRDRRALRCLCGVAPVTKRSGKSLVVSRRLAVHPHLQDAVHHWARVATQVDPATKAKYRALRDRGHNHARALRTVGDRLLAIACAMLRNQTLFAPQVAPPPGDADHAA